MMKRLLTILVLPLLTTFTGANCDGATIPSWTCVAPENPDPCGMQIVARGWIAERTDGSLDTYGMNVLGAAHASGGPGITKIRVAFKRPMTMGPHYQVLITGYSPTGKAFMVPRFGKHDAFFEVVVPDDWESFDFVVIGL